MVSSGTKYWWANQRTRWRPERTLGHVFAPLPDSGPKYELGWENVRYLRPGHIIVHNKGSKLLAVSEVRTAPRETRRPTLPDETDAEKNVAGYRSLGTLVEVNYLDINPPISVSAIDLDWKVPKLGPFSDAPKTLGRPTQIYIEILSPRFVEMLRNEFPNQWPSGY